MPNRPHIWTSTTNGGTSDSADTYVGTIVENVSSEYSDQIVKLSGVVTVTPGPNCDQVFIVVSKDALGEVPVSGNPTNIGLCVPTHEAPYAFAFESYDAPGEAAGQSYYVVVICANSTGTNTFNSVSMSARID